MKKLSSIVLLFIINSLIIAQNEELNPKITAEEIQDHISFLASDELRGRFTGSEGNDKAGEYIESEFEKYGLTPLFDGSYFQEFTVLEDIEFSENNSISFISNSSSQNLELNNDFIVIPFSGDSEIESELVFAGYGISAPNLEYDDYNGLNVNDKIVIAMRFKPEPDSVKSDFDKHTPLRKKAAVARDKGARAIIFVNGHEEKNKDDDFVKLKFNHTSGMNDFGIVHVKRNIVDELFAGEGLDFNLHQKKILDSKQPASFAFNDTKVKLNTEVNEIEKVARNVGGYFEGNDPALKNEYIVIGAHYDHIGMGQVGSMYKGAEPQIHNGADDNASGTSGVLELAEKFSGDKNIIKRSLIFVTFSGEELGLLGSAYLVSHFPIPLENVTAMLNMDMIGRLNEDKNLTVIGTGTSSIWKDLLNEKNTYEFNLSFNDDGFGGSDHQSFAIKKIPVLFFFTGIHSDYHRPTDDADKINSKGEESIVNYVYSIADYIDKIDSRPEYVAVKREASRGGMNSKVYIGTVPEFGYQGDGFKMSGVSKGSPAQKAGLKGGDIMIKFGDKNVSSIYDFMYGMNDYAPGDTVDVVVLRDGKEVTVQIELGSR